MKKILFSALICIVMSTRALYSEDINFGNEINNAQPDYIEKVYQLALVEFDKRNYDKSLMYIRHVIKSDMNNYKLRYLAAHDHWKLGSFDSATAHFQTAVLAHPENPQGYMDLALMKLHERNYAVAERTLESGLYFLQKGNIPVPSKFYNIYSRLELMKGRPAESLAYAEKAKAVFNQSGTGTKDKLEAMTLEARSQLLLQNFDKAELAAQWAVSMRKNNVYAQNLLGYIYTKWHENVKTSDPVRAEELKKLALESFQSALKTPDIIEEFKSIIETNIANLK